MANHTWKFFRAGGFDQVKLETGADLLALDQLDQKLWVALACPTTGVEFDTKTLVCIDTDKDGRIRVSELLTAVKWACACLKTPDTLLKSSPALPLDLINDATPEGKQVLASARQILVNLNKKDANTITLDDTADTTKIYAQTNFNGDGIVPIESAEDEATRIVIKDIIDCLGAEMDRSGKPGVNQAKVDKFFSEAQAYSDWCKKAESDPAIRPLDGGTDAAAATFRAVKSKVDDYFTRCRLAAFDPRAANALNREEKEYLAVAAKDLNITSSEIAGFPLAQIGASKPLPLKEGLNPAWADILATFEVQVVRPMFNGKGVLSESDWTAISAKFAAHEAWVATKAGVTVEKLGIQRVRQVLANNSKESITALIGRDKALEPEANAIESVDRLLRYQRDLYKLLNNFVNFRDFYGRKDKAIFQAGKLYLDQRSCDLCLVVQDPGRHALMAGLAGTYLAYCDCVRQATGEKMQIVAAFTNGDSDNLMVGRNGIFYDRKGRDWDATITRIIDNPISIRQAFWAPYKKTMRAIEEQIAKRAADADAAATQNLTQTASATVAADKPAPKPPPPKSKMDTGTLAALGLVLSTLLAALGGIFGAIAKLPAYQVPLAIIGILLAISLPSMCLAYLKLRKRNLGPILDANNWAVNARAKINVPFGGSLTQVATLPPGATRDMVDPFAEKKRPWKFYILVISVLMLGLLWYLGNLDRLLPGKLKSTEVLGVNAPAYVPPPGVTVTNVPAAPAK